MNRMDRFFKVSFFLAMLICSTGNATVLVTGGGGTAPFTFAETTTVRAKVFDRATGTLYLGVAATTASVYKALRPFGDVAPLLTAIETDPGLGGSRVDFLALATSEGNINPKVACVSSDTTLGDTKYVSLLYVKSDKSNALVQSPLLLDASGGVGTDGAEVSGIVGLAANVDTIFAAVQPASGSFGDPDGGIAVVCIYQDGDTVVLSQAAAVAGDSGIKAQLFDNTIPEIALSGGGQPTLVLDKIDLQWDDRLQRLYAGVQLTTSSDQNSGGKSVVVMQQTDCGVLTRRNIVADSALAGTGTTAIVVTDQQNDALSAIHVRVMHCTTGPSYLIVNGGNGDQPTTNDLIFALPLVDNPSDVANHGTLAKKDSLLVNYKFVTPATVAGDLATSSDASAMVGAGALPISITTPISDIEVIDDTVYVSIGVASGADNDNGIFYSQAVFDEKGKVLRWTPWAKRAYPFNAFDDAPCDCQGVFVFAVDALTGRVWAVDWQTQRIVRLTAWNCCETSSAWTQRVGQSMQQGCYSVLDLDQGTRGFVGERLFDRYALFGGVNKIAMMRVSEAYAATLYSPQQVFEDMSDPANFIEFRLPDPAGCVTHLEYARRLTNDVPNPSNYFFAGTSNGLFAFAKKIPAGGGFNPSELGPLNNALMLNASWNYIDAIEGAILGLRTTGKNLYVLARTIDEGAFVYKLYRVPFQTTLAAMFAPANIVLIAQSGVGVFEQSLAFSAIEPIKTGPTPASPGDKEQLVLATSRGLFRSDADQILANGIIDAANQTDANWVPLPANNTTCFVGITGMDESLPGTVWPFSCEDQGGLGTFEKSKIYQVGGEGNTAGTQALFNSFVPPLFNARSETSAFQFLDPILAFWSEGARRFFAIDPVDQVCGDTCKREQFMILPYDTIGWNVTSPGDGFVASERTVDSRTRYYWMHHIGATGVLMVGTERGVIALE